MREATLWFRMVTRGPEGVEKAATLRQVRSAEYLAWTGQMGVQLELP
jgi:hypothetical protein